MGRLKRNNAPVPRHSEKLLKFTGGAAEIILRILVWIAAALILAALPFYMQDGYTHIGSDKSYFFRSGCAKLGSIILPVLGVCVLCRLVEALLHRKERLFQKWLKGLCVTDYLAFLYGISVIVSYLCSDYRETALWGTTGWYMGMLPQLAFVTLYFLIRFFQVKAEWMLILNMLASGLAFALGYLNRFNIWPIPIKYSERFTFISTIGNINWYCGYLMAVFFVGVGILWLQKKEKNGIDWGTWLLCGYVLIGFATLITQGSESGVFALAAVLFVMFVISAKDGDRHRIDRFWLIVLLLAIAGGLTFVLRLIVPGRITFTFLAGDLLTYSPLPFAMAAVAATGILMARRGEGAPFELLRRGMRILSKICCVAVLPLFVSFVGMIVLNTLRPGSLGGLSGMGVFTFDNAWGSSRGATWTLGLRCFLEQDFLHKLTGVGPDCMADFLYKGGSESLLAAAQQAFENMRLTNAHCEPLTILVNEGILGMLCYVGMLLSHIYYLTRKRADNACAAACGLCVLAYLVNSLWSFQQTMGAAPLFVIMGLGGNLLHRSEASHPQGEQFSPRHSQSRKTDSFMQA